MTKMKLRERRLSCMLAQAAFLILPGIMWLAIQLIFRFFVKHYDMPNSDLVKDEAR